jgi:pimeloyl-ACP methyl ester carboxylesterase
MNTSSSSPVPVVLIPALLCDDGLYRDVVDRLGDRIAPQVLMSPKPSLEDSAADILARAPERFVLVGTSYGGSLAMEVALAAPQRVKALWLMGCDPGAPSAGNAGLADGLEATPEAVFGMLAGLVVRKEATAEAEVFKAMAARVGGTAARAWAS